MEALEEPRPPALLGTENRVLGPKIAVGPVGEGLIQGFELGGRDEDAAAVKVPVAEDGEPGEVRLVAGVELLVGVPVTHVEADCHAAGREAHGFADDRFEVHTGESLGNCDGRRNPFAAPRAVRALVEGRQYLVMDQTWVLIDGHTGLHVRWYFWLRVLDEVNRSTRYGAPFALLLVDAGPGSASAKVRESALAGLPAAVRSTDLAGKLDVGQAAVLLTHQDADSAEQARQRILDRLAPLTPQGVSWETSLYCYPEHAAEISNLLTTGNSERAIDEPSLGHTA